MIIQSRFIRNSRGAAALAVALLALGTAPAIVHAAPAAAVWAPHEGFDGLWRNAGRGQRGRDGGSGLCCSEEGWHDTYTILLPWALEVMAKRDAGLVSGDVIPTNTQECKPDGVPTVIEIPYPFQVLQTRDELTILYEADYQGRHVRMGGVHPAKFTPNWSGDSVGRWDGDVLVIDTIGLSKKGQTNWDGIPHTDQLQVVERYKLTAPGAIELTMTLTDPGTFKEPWTIVKHFRKIPERRLMEYVCAENNRDAAVPTE